jgi:penicillin-binding protein-related factor A (putative recombinase)
MVNLATEKVIENSILNFLKHIGVFCWKNQSVGIYDSKKKIFRKSTNSHHIKGCSDILGIIEGRMIAIEVKAEKGKISPEQRVFITRINQEGGVAFVARSIDQVAIELYKAFPEHKILKEMISHEWGKPSDIDKTKH